MLFTEGMLNRRQLSLFLYNRVIMIVLFLLAQLNIAFATQQVIDSLSFGHGSSISSNKISIPNWEILGDGHAPTLLSDRLILTPPSPGNRRGAIWAKTKNTQTEWTADFEFRATGPERGGGNLQIWYTREGQGNVGTSSVYTIGKFDGLALTVDMYGGRGGSIRGFLNDGNTDYKSHHSVDSLAFGHCDFSYRNLGRPSSIQIKHESNSFEVIVNHRQCFWSDKIKLPSGYYFGVTAASAETPDTFEAFKFLLTTSSTTQNQPRQDPPSNPPPPSNPYAPPEDTQASTIASQEAQFADLHNRMQIMAHALDNTLTEVRRLAEKSEGRHQELLRNAASADKLKELDQKIQNVETSLQSNKQQLTSVQRLLSDSHRRLTVGLPEHMSEIISTKSPRMGFFLFIFIVFQLLLAGSYVVYKRRKANGPKKYL